MPGTLVSGSHLHSPIMAPAKHAPRLNASCVTKSSSNSRTISLRRRLCKCGGAMFYHPPPHTQSKRTGTYIADCVWPPRVMCRRHLAHAEGYDPFAHSVACKLLCSGELPAWPHHTHRGATRLTAHREPWQCTPKKPRARGHR